LPNHERETVGHITEIIKPLLPQPEGIKLATRKNVKENPQQDGSILEFHLKSTIDTL
jgi:hypothetical protein